MENFAKLKTQDIKSQAERKDIYLDNDFIAISKYIKITDEDINRLKKKLKEQCNKIKKYKEKIDKKIIKETNKDKKEYLEFINDFWALYLNKI